jgi:tRNA U34 5-methylaminomethyl-2-thiouridine-forming methyltransferase MnmC
VSLEIILTDDDSNSLRHLQLNETYHSIHGAVQESRHVFIQNGLAFLALSRPAEISILEVGFGTALNALLTLQFARQIDQKVMYTAIEPFPITEDLWSKLNYPLLLNDEEAYRLLHRSEWGITIPLGSVFKFLKLQTTLQTTVLKQESFDLIYYDAFAPAKQPDLWEIEVLEKVITCMKPGGVFVTYSARGQVKRDLRALGLSVETLPGPPGKKEMIRSIRI